VKTNDKNNNNKSLNTSIYLDFEENLSFENIEQEKIS